MFFSTQESFSDEEETLNYESDDLPIKMIRIDYKDSVRQSSILIKP